MTDAETVQPYLSNHQLEAYLDHVGLAPERRFPDCPRDAALLHALHVHHITAIPYENLGLHYAPEPHISTDISHILTKALQNGRGGYCLEGNLLFNAVLRSLGFDAYLTGARIRLRTGNVPRGPWQGLQHVVNIITLDDGTKITSDVAFGGDGPVQPLPLQRDVVTTNLGTQEVRLAFEPLKGAATGQKWWIYQYRNRSTDEWNAYYTFQETEFLLSDFEVMNWFCSANPRHFHRVIPIVVKFLTDEASASGSNDEKDSAAGIKRVAGKVMLADKVIKRNTGGRTEVLVTCANDDQRIDGLQRYFGMTFTVAERAGIRGRVSEIVQ